MIIDNIFLDIGIIIVVATFFGFVAKVFKQPLIPAYVFAGLLLGPILKIITDKGIISTLSEFGILFLLFMVGLEIDLRKLKSVGLVAGVGGLARSLLLFSIGFIFMLIIGFKSLEAVYIGIVLAFSSTMVVVKILSDRQELNTLHGRLILGFLLVEDILAMVVISVLSQLNEFSFTILLVALWKAAIIILGAKVINKYIFPPLFKFAAKSQELLFLSSISACFLFALFFAQFEFSIPLGAFVAGVILANLPYTYEMIGRVKSMRDFFATIFFVSLGMSIVPIPLSYVFVTIGLLIIVWVIKTFITFFMTSFFGYNKRPSFLTSISLTQTGEFSLIIVTQGLIFGHISEEIFSITAILAVVTMGITSYFIKYEYRIYQPFKNFLRRFDKFGKSTNGDSIDEKENYDVLLIGYDRIGYSIVKKLHILKKKLLVVDFNPEVIKKIKKQNIHGIYGDIGDVEILHRIKLKKLSMVISTSPDMRDNELLIKKVKAVNEKAKIFVTAYSVDDALELYEAKADYVIVPHLLGGDHVSLMIEEFGDNHKELLNCKSCHIEELRERQKLGHEHKHHPHHKKK